MKSRSTLALALALAASLGSGLAKADVPPQETARAEAPDSQDQVKALVKAGKLDVARAGNYRSLFEANVRGQSGTNSPIVGHLPKGAVVSVLGRVPNSWWYAVATEKSIGYVSSELLSANPVKGLPSIVVPDAKSAVVAAPGPDVKPSPEASPDLDTKPAGTGKGDALKPLPGKPVATPLLPPSFDRLTTPAVRSKVTGPREISMCPIPGPR